MTAVRRAMIPEAELRRWARVSRKEGVAIRGRRDPDGGLTVEISPSASAPSIGGDDLDDRLAAFGAG